jgi:hypothetical protein
LSILARILRDRGVVTERQLKEAIQHQVLYGGRLGTSLYELGFVTEDRLREALSRVHGVPSVAVDPREIQAEVLELVPKAVAAKHKVFPYKTRGRTLFLLMVDPADHAALARVGYSVGYVVKPLVVAEFRMADLLRDYYGVDERWRFADTWARRAPAAAVPLDVGTAAARVDVAETRDDVMEALVGLAQRFFRRVICFIVREPWAIGWSGTGEGMDRSLATSLRIPLDRPSVFGTVVREKTPFIGRLGPEEEDQRFLKALSKKPSTSAALIPVNVLGRVVNLIYGDNGASGQVRTDLGELFALVQKAPRAYLRIIRRRLAETRKAAGTDPGANEGVVE